MLRAFEYLDDKLCHTTDRLSQAQWIDLAEPAPDEVERVARETGLAIPTEAEINEIESSSRLATRDGALYLSMPVVSRPDSDPRSVSVGFVLSPDRLITIRFAQSRLFDRFMEQQMKTDAKSGGAHIMVALLEAIVDRQAE